MIIAQLHPDNLYHLFGLEQTNDERPEIHPLPGRRLKANHNLSVDRRRYKNGQLHLFHNSYISAIMATDKDILSQAFENTSTNVAASQMRNALNNLIDTVKEPSEKKVN